jgi:hypothetical protein
MGFWNEGGSFRSAGMSERFKQRAIDVTSRYLLQAQEHGYVRTDISVGDMIQWLLDVSLILVLFKPDYELDDIRHHIRTMGCPASKPDPPRHSTFGLARRGNSYRIRRYILRIV